MSTPNPPPPPPPVTTPTPAPLNPAVPPPAAPAPPKPIPASFTVLEHTGIPRSILSWKPKLPSRNWSIFLSIVGTISYLYYDDRRQCKKLKQEYIDRVKSLAEEPTSGSMDVPRKVKVYGARWPEDDDDDRALKYFRRYVKPYLVAAAIDYEQETSPLYGSITRQVQAGILKKRRQALGLEQTPFLNLPGMLDPPAMAKKELEGGVVVIGRHSLKEYMEGLRRGFGNGVSPWKWEEEIEGQLYGDGVFEEKVETEVIPEPVFTPEIKPKSPSGLPFLARPAPPPPTSPDYIPPHLHLAPNPLPPQPPILLVPFTNHLGFKQFPRVVLDFFNERKRVKEGGEAAMKLILGGTRDFNGPQTSDPDTDFDKKAETFYLKSFGELSTRFDKARTDYYDSLKTRLDSVRQLASGERQLTPEEEKSTKPLVTEKDLKEERKKKELRWRGMMDGYEIVKPDSEVAWEDGWQGWLKVFEDSER